MTISKKGKPYCFQPTLEQNCGGILRKQTGEFIQLLVRGFFFPVLRNIHITYLAEHINAIVKKIFNMKPLYLSSSEHTCMHVHMRVHTHTHTSLLSHPHSDTEALLCNDSNVFISMCNNGKVIICDLKS